MAPPATARDAGGGSRSLIPILLVRACLLHSAFCRSAWFGPRERWGGGAMLLEVEKGESTEGKGGGQRRGGGCWEEEEMMWLVCLVL